MTDIVSVREFARRIGVSLPAVQKAVKNGRITAVTDDNGKLKGIDWDTQKDAWVQNSNPAFRRNQLAYQPDGMEATPFPAKENANKGGRPRKDGKAAAPREGEVVDTLEGQPHGGALKRSQTTPPAKGEMTLAEIKRARELVNLNRDKLKLDEEKKVLVSAAEQHQIGATLAAGVISGLYNIIDIVTPELASMTDPHAIRELLRVEMDKAVEGIRKAYGHQ